jgi:uncharacterized protein
MLAFWARLLIAETKLVVKSRHVVPGRLQEAGFGWEFLLWRDAAGGLLRRVS